MQVKRSNILRHFRGRRIVIPLLAVAVAAFLVFGGYRALVSFAMDEMTGFLAGTGGGGDGRALAQPAAPIAPRAQTSVPTTAVASQPIAATASADPRVAKAEPSEAPVLLAKAGPVSAVKVAQATPPATTVRRPAVNQPAPVDTTVFRKEVRAYTATFLRDPFHSLIQAGKEHVGKLLDVGRAIMVGSVWGESGIIALLEDDTGRSFALRVGDRVENGRVIAVTPASVTFSITTFGITKTVTLELAEEGE